MLQLVAVSLAISLISVRVSKSLYMIRSSNASMYCANYQALDNLAFSEPPREPAPLYVHPRPFFLSLVLSQLPVTIVRHQIRVPLDRPAVRDWSGLGPAAFDVPKIILAAVRMERNPSDRAVMMPAQSGSPPRRSRGSWTPCGGGRRLRRKKQNRNTLESELCLRCALPARKCITDQ